MKLSEKKLDYLRQSVGFSSTDMSLDLRMALSAINAQRGEAWTLIALSKQPLEEWEKWGVGLMSKFDFINEVNAKLKMFEDLFTDEDIDKEYKRRADKKHAKSLRVDDDVVRHRIDFYNAQGGHILDIIDCNSKGKYLCYNRSVYKDPIAGPQYIDTLFAHCDNLTYEEKVQLIVGTQIVSAING